MKDIFCANEQKITPHTASIDGNGEFVFTCECGRFVKFPTDTDPSTFDSLIAAHEQSNTGQVSIEAQQKKLDALLGTQEALPQE